MILQVAAPRRCRMTGCTKRPRKKQMQRRGERSGRRSLCVQLAEWVESVKKAEWAAGQKHTASNAADKELFTEADQSRGRWSCSEPLRYGWKRSG